MISDASTAINRWRRTFHQGLRVARSKVEGTVFGIQRIISLTHNLLWLPSNWLPGEVPLEVHLV